MRSFGGMAQRAFKALQDVNLSIRYGEVIGLVGESGSEKARWRGLLLV